MRRSLLIVLDMFLFISVICNTSSLIDDSIALGETLIVDINNSSDHGSIQSAIDVANPGDSIQVNPGTYYETITITKSITLMGIDKSNTIINGKGEVIFNISSDNVIIHGFTLQNGSYCMELHDSNGCIISDNNLINSEYGIYIRNSSSNSLVYNNNFKNNHINAFDASESIWHFSSIGNYWDDYSGTDSDDNGIGDEQYNISGGNNKDEFPKINPFSEQPSASFSMLPSYPSTEDMIILTDNSTDDEGIISWYWDFGDGTTSSEQNAEHSYEDNGIFTISLTVTDMFELTSTATISISVRNVPPQCSFIYTPSQPTDIEQVTFKDTSIDSDGNIVNRTWTIDGNDTKYGENISVQFPDNGTYTIQLLVTDDDGATAAHTKNIQVANVPPTASFTFSGANERYLVEDTIQFNDHSYDQDGSIVSWSWELGDGTSSTEKNPTHIYHSSGSYPIQLTIIDNDGAVDTLTKTLTISNKMIQNEWDVGLTPFDIGFIIFIIIMVVMVFTITRKYSK